MSEVDEYDKCDLGGALIKDLQDLKLNQLIQLEKYPITSKQALDDRVRELSCQDKGNPVSEALKSLSSPSARLVGKLAIDVAENYIKHAEVTENKLLRTIRKKYLLYGDDFLAHNTPVHPLLKQWYEELKILAINGGSPAADTSLVLQDREAFSIKYEPMCLKCRKQVGLASSDLDNDTDAKQVARLFFSSCHYGYCCRVMVESACQLCSTVSESRKPSEKTCQATDPIVCLNVDPAFCYDVNVPAISKETKSVSSFIHSELWTFIDELLKPT